MGILDDAIREHLELKRQHGADSDDVERLEKEAFGPPTRPGDPEFDTSEAEAAAATTAPDAAAASEAPTTIEPGPGSEATDAPSAIPSPADPEAASGAIFDAESDEGDEDWLSSLEDVVEEPLVGSEEDAPDAPAAASDPAEATLPSSDDLTPTERARLEHPDLGDTVAHPVVPEPGTEDPVSSPSEPESRAEPEAPEPPEPPESAIFEQEGGLEDLDLELDIEEAEAGAESAAAAPPSSVSDEAPVAPLEPDSVDAELDLELDPEGEEVEAVPERPATDEFEADDAEEDELEDDDEDLLNETPDFLQDAPEGDRLWFEQGAPKDFDFEDDDER